jgi:hypothetical protein
MKERLYCKDCKDTIVDPGMYNLTACKCGKTQVQKVIKGYAVSPGANYCMVDDEGNEILIKDEPAAAHKQPSERGGDGDPDSEAKMRELMLALAHQIEAMESWSSQGRFAPCTNQDLLAHLVWLNAWLKLQREHYGAMMLALEERVEAQELLLARQGSKKKGSGARRS